MLLTAMSLPLLQTEEKMGFRLVLKVVNHDPCEAYLSKPNLLRRRVWRFHSLQSPFLLCIYHHNQSRSLSSVLQSFYSGKTKPNICSNNVLTKVEMIKQLLRLPKIGMALTKSFSETLTALLQRFQLSSSSYLSLSDQSLSFMCCGFLFCRLVYMEDK